jgi:hypothetical protein
MKTQAFSPTAQEQDRLPPARDFAHKNKYSQHNRTGKSNHEAARLRSFHSEDEIRTKSSTHDLGRTLSRNAEAE